MAYCEFLYGFVFPTELLRLQYIESVGELQCGYAVSFYVSN
jgi:hypothetical protein